MLNKSGRFKRGTYNPIRAAREHALTKVLIKNVSNEGNFRKWVEKMSERKGLPIYTAKVNEQQRWQILSIVITMIFFSFIE